MADRFRYVDTNSRINDPGRANVSLCRCSHGQVGRVPAVSDARIANDSIGTPSLYLKAAFEKGRLCHSVRLMGLFWTDDSRGRNEKTPHQDSGRERVLHGLRGLCFLAVGWCVVPLPLQGQQSIPPRVETGYVTSSDGIRLYYAKVGSGSETAIIPGRLFTFPDFQRLAKGRTLIFYDMRNRGLSDAVIDLSKISLQHDTDDLEAVRVHFGIETPNLIGFSYLGKIVVLYATQHPNHVNRIVQIGPVARKFGTKFPEALTAGDEDKVPDPAEIKRMETLHTKGFAKSHPKEFCEMEWRVEQQRMVGDPVNAGRIPSPCEMKNEWPIHLWPHFDSLLASDQVLDIPKESVAKVTVPVLTIHGTKDRNAPYGGGVNGTYCYPMPA